MPNDFYINFEGKKIKIRKTKNPSGIIQFNFGATLIVN